MSSSGVAQYAVSGRLKANSTTREPVSSPIAESVVARTTAATTTAGGKESRNVRNKRRMRAARAWMASLKVDIACADCGETFPTYVMHWDHLPGFEKIESISVLVGRFPRNLVLEELKKCELVCANCHVLRTISRAARSAAC